MDVSEKLPEKGRDAFLVSSNPSLDEGQVLQGRYMLMKRIAQGGTSDIFRARDMLAVIGPDDRQSHIAIKIVKAELACEGQDLLLYEALTTRHLSHPNIVKVYDFHKEGSISFVTMELIDGESLADYMRRLPNKRLTHARMMSIFNEVCKALTYAHGQGVIHSDIKPSNILLLDSGQVKVIDFATARAFIDSNTLQPEQLPAKFYGYTLAYSSPETIADKPASPRDDVFSLACIVYEMLTGEHPFDRMPSCDVNQNYRIRQPKGLSIWPWLVLKIALSLDGNKRFQSINYFQRALKISRYAWVLAASSILFVVSLVWGGIGLNQHWQAKSEYQAKIEGLYDAQQKELQSVGYIKSQPVDQWLKLLPSLNDIPEPFRSDALSVLRNDLIEYSVNSVKVSLSEDPITGVLPNFDDLSALIDEISVYYPDSAKLSEISHLLVSTKEQIISMLQYHLKKSWNEPIYTGSSAEKINNFYTRVRLLSKAGSLSVDKKIEEYSKQVKVALDNKSYLVIYELHQFSERLDIPNSGFKSVWNTVDLAVIENSKALALYLNSNGQQSTYPEAALLFFAESEFNLIRNAVELAWLDKDIIAAKENVDRFVEKYSIPLSSGTRKDINQLLIEKLKAKIEYHRKKGYESSLANMKYIYDEFIASIQGTTGVN